MTPENRTRKNGCKICKKDQTKTEEYKISREKWRAANPTRCKLYALKATARGRDELSRSYVARIMGISVKNIHPEIIELKRMMIQLTRAKRAYLKGERHV
jgi:hypothetical protein